MSYRAAFAADPGTEAVVLLGEIGGTMAEDAAAFIAEMYCIRRRPSFGTVRPRGFGSVRVFEHDEKTTRSRLASGDVRWGAFAESIIER